jgi:hypothetical protein
MLTQRAMVVPATFVTWLIGWFVRQILVGRLAWASPFRGAGAILPALD